MEEWKKIGKKNLDLFRLAYADYNHWIFRTDGEIKTLKQYLKVARLVGEEAEEMAPAQTCKAIAEKWYKEVEVLSKKKLPIHKACMVLINRLRMLEGSWDANDENDSAVWSQISWNPASGRTSNTSNPSVSGLVDSNISFSDENEFSLTMNELGAGLNKKRTRSETRNKQVECKVCLRKMRSDTIKRHMKKHRDIYSLDEKDVLNSA